MRNDGLAKELRHAAVEVVQVGKIANVIRLGDDQALRLLDGAVHLVEINVAFAGEDRALKMRGARVGRIINVANEIAAAAISFALDEAVVVRGDDELDLFELREHGVNRSRGTSDVNFFPQGADQRAAVTALHEHKILRHAREVIRRAVGVLALFGEPPRKLAAGGQAGHFFVRAFAKGRACARAEKRQAFAGLSRVEDEFEILRLQAYRTPSSKISHDLPLLLKESFLYSDLIWRETSMAWCSARTTSMLFSLL